jgi:hypothetical protein
MFRKLDLFQFSGEVRETPTPLGPIEISSLNHSTELRNAEFRTVKHHHQNHFCCTEHIVTFWVLCDYRRRVRIGKTDYWTCSLVVTIQSNSSRICTVYNSLQQAFSLRSLLCLRQLSGNGFSRLGFPFL